MPLTPGVRLGPYEIVAPLGQGGMGEVHRARDTRLGRDVALKILPDAVARDPDRLARFEREAKTLAALNHPNIAQIHGVEESSETRALVMELVEGEGLDETIRSAAARRESSIGSRPGLGLLGGGLSLDEALAIARQIAEALEAAHAQGIVHRDLKPANVRVRPDGTVKVLDFGLAKAIEPGTASRDASDASVSRSPTITTPAMTAAGVILGTAAYMAPEQAKGHSADRRADIWAFGCVLYEMLTGVRLFGGADVAETLAAVLRQDPDWTRLPADTPPSVHRLLRRCLVRDPRMRLPDIGVARLEIDEALASPVVAASNELPSRGRSTAVAVLAAIAGLAAGAALVAWLRVVPAPPAAEPRALHVASGAGLSWPRLSPDGRSLAFVRDGKLFVRALDSLIDREVETTGGAAVPAWSPDGSSIAYFATGDTGPELRTVSAQGGASRVVARSVRQGPDTRLPPFAPFGAAWCANGLWFSRFGEGLWRADGDGRDSLVFGIDREAGDTNFAYPSCLPDGRVLVTAARGSRNLITALGGAGRVTLATVPAAFDTEGARWPVLAGGHVVYDRAQDNVGLWAVPVNTGVTAATGAAKQLLAGGQQVSVSANGLLATVTGERVTDRELVWVDRAGTRLSAFGRPMMEFMWPSLSPAGDRVVVQGNRGGTEGLWIHAESTVRPLVASPLASVPAWSPKDDRILFLRGDGGPKGELIIAPASGGDGVRLDGPVSPIRPEWAPDASAVVYESRAESEPSIWLMALRPGVKPRRLIGGGEPAVSPDGRYLAFSDNSTGQRQVYVTAFPNAGEPLPVPGGEGRHPRWNRKGDEVFFACGPRIGDDPNSRRDLCAAPFDRRAGRPGRARVLFNAERLGYRVTMRGPRFYDVGPDPNRILVMTAGVEGVPAITLLENVEEWIRRAR